MSESKQGGVVSVPLGATEAEERGEIAEALKAAEFPYAVRIFTTSSRGSRDVVHVVGVCVPDAELEWASGAAYVALVRLEMVGRWKLLAFDPVDAEGWRACERGPALAYTPATPGSAQRREPAYELEVRGLAGEIQPKAACIAMAVADYHEISGDVYGVSRPGDPKELLALSITKVMVAAAEEGSHQEGDALRARVLDLEAENGELLELTQRAVSEYEGAMVLSDLQPLIGDMARLLKDRAALSPQTEGGAS